MNREKQRDDGIIAGVSAATSAIVSATAHNPAKALSVLAASFGLATALNDAIFSSYLFTEAPGLISVKVKGLQEPIITPEGTYNAIQNYYHICLPQSIEGILLQAVADSSAKSNNPSNNSTPKLVNNTATAKGN